MMFDITVFKQTDELIVYFVLFVFWLYNLGTGHADQMTNRDDGCDIQIVVLLTCDLTSLTIGGKIHLPDVIDHRKG